MKILIIRATVVTPIGEVSRIAAVGETVDVEKADATLLVALKRAQWLKASDAQAASVAQRGETADMRPTAKARQ